MILVDTTNNFFFYYRKNTKSLRIWIKKIDAVESGLVTVYMHAGYEALVHLE